MNITSRTRISYLLEDHPELMDVFHWMEATPSSGDRSLSLDEFCNARDVDLEDLLAELRAAKVEKATAELADTLDIDGEAGDFDPWD